MSQWYRGNTHAHTTRSDGDVAPEEAVGWFRGHGYDFVCLTDHFTTPEPGFAEAHSDEGFLVIPGQELSTLVGRIPLHVNALGSDTTIPEPEGRSVAKVLGEMVRLVRAWTPVVSLNHPNFHAAFTADEMMPIEDPYLLEVYNGHPQVFNFGWPGRPSVEAMWDALLGRGRRVFGVACDDSHHYEPSGRRPAFGYAGPGLGWVQVRAEALTREAILGSLLEGDFYASTGVELEDIGTENGIYRVSVKAGSVPCRFQFIGAGGSVLAEDTGISATFRLQGETGYVRARVVGERGAMAWTQPVFPAG